MALVLGNDGGILRELSLLLILVGQGNRLPVALALGVLRRRLG